MDDFQTTRWSLVLEARGAETRSRRALEALCRTYRAPVVAYIGRSGALAADVEDLAQTFFTRFVDRAFHEQADPARGRFRAFLLTALKNFLIDAHGHAHAIKRGGHVMIQSMDSAISGNGGSDDLVDAETPEQVFDRAWAQAVLHAALRKLRREANDAGKSQLFDALSEFLIERPDEADYARVAADLGMRRNTLAVAVHRMRNRLRELVYRELAETAANDADLQQEMAHLSHSLGALLE
jgi:RNA polymerase sigma-70 factor (ECF subfamily)